ncbi:MAG TPA: trypsin-like peptidase domain-containing protein [Blastocatellia bacterium]|nr:trypsin-like peptidase domain-containing protein [Blastocatellia bacterium]
MGNGIVIRLAGVRQPTTRIFHQEVISVGTASDCDLVIEAEEFSLPPESIILTLRRQDDAYRITTVDQLAGVTRDGEAVAIGDALSDGDTFYFGDTGIRLRAFAVTEPDDITESLRLGVTVLANARPSRPPAAVGQRSMPRTDVALVFVKQLLRELVAEIPRRVLYVIAGIAGVIAFILITIISVNTLGFLEGRRNNQAISGLQQKLGEVSGEIDKLSSSLQEARNETSNIRSSLSLPEKIVNSYGQGVCLIYGTYVFVDPRVGGGSEIKFKEPSGAENPIGPDGAVNLSVDGNGRVYEVEFMGTGFLAAKGSVLTNRHVIQAWDEDDIASLIMNRGFRPRLKELLAYFPQTPQPFKLTPAKVSSDQDVALCSFDQGGAELLPLPLDETSDGVASGQSVVLLGYPAGLEGLIARTNNISKANRRLYGNLSYRTQLNELAASSKIRPQSTQGHISDVSPQLVYDARTDEGGSGGPVFGANGKVIGINQAILMSSQSTASFGVPIRHGLALLKKYQQSQVAKK